MPAIELSGSAERRRTGPTEFAFSTKLVIHERSHTHQTAASLSRTHTHTRCSGHYGCAVPANTVRQQQNGCFCHQRTGQEFSSLKLFTRCVCVFFRSSLLRSQCLFFALCRCWFGRSLAQQAGLHPMRRFATLTDDLVCVCVLPLPCVLHIDDPRRWSGWCKIWCLLI